jgi:serine/threonine protein phosphatase PrpC
MPASTQSSTMRKKMMKIWKIAYLTKKWVRLTTWAALLGGSICFFWLTGGFPPRGWRILAQALPNLPALWALRGLALLPPLLALLAYSCMVLFVWCFLIGTAGWAIVQQWFYMRTWRRVEEFARSVQRADETKKPLQEQQPWQLQRPWEEPTETIPAPVVPLQTATKAVRNVNLHPPMAPALQSALELQTQPQSPVGTASRATSNATSSARPSVSTLPRAASNTAHSPMPPVGTSLYTTANLLNPANTAMPPASTSRHITSHLPNTVIPPMSTSPHTTSNLLNSANTAMPPASTSPRVTPDFLNDAEPPVATSLHSAANFLNSAGPISKSTVLPTTDPQPTPDSHVVLRVGTKLDPGITRKLKQNEDHLLAVHGTHTHNADFRPYGLFVVADGMGGHANGHEASRLAVQHVRNSIIPTLLSNVDLDSIHCKELLLEGIQHANLAIYQQNRQQGCDMGSTITAAILVGSMLTIANVGDSRTYSYSEGAGLKQVTRDHSMVARMVEKGIICADEIYTHPQRNQIYRCLGETASVQIDTFSLPYQSGDTLVLCSDGLWEMMRDVLIQDTLHNTLPDASLATEELVKAALIGGGKDNISVIVVHHV